MAWRDWISYPGELEDRNMVEMVKALMEVTTLLMRLNKRVCAIEEILIDRNMAKRTEIMEPKSQFDTAEIGGGQ